MSKLCVNTGAGGGGSGGTGAGGGGAAGSAAGGSGGHPPAPTCASSAECGSTEVCAFDADATGHCLAGSQKDCSGTPAHCIRNMGFEFHAGKIEGDICQTSADCEVVKGHLQGVCADLDGIKACVHLCQYHDDPALLSCVTDPRFGLSDFCSRNHARLYVTFAVTASCASEKVVKATCKSPTADFASGMEWTVACIEGHIASHTSSCSSIVLADQTGCFVESKRPEATMGATAWVNETAKYLDVQTQSGGSGSTTQSCGTDCDCGHCSYCEKGTCYYGGEGPYGCYRGCP